MSFYKNYIKNNQSYFKDNFEDKSRLLNTVERFLEFSNCEKLTNKKILDIGGGDGAFTEVCKKNNIDSINLDAGKNNINFENDKLPFKDNNFDAVTAFALIEHISNINFLLHEIKRVLKPGGLVIVTTPNFRFCYKNFYDDPTHIKPYTDKSIKTLFVNSGFEAINIKPFVVKKNKFYWTFKYSFELCAYLPFTNHQLPCIPIPNFLRGKSTSIIGIFKNQQKNI